LFYMLVLFPDYTLQGFKIVLNLYDNFMFSSGIMNINEPAPEY